MNKEDIGQALVPYNAPYQQTGKCLALLRIEHYLFRSLPSLSDYEGTFNITLDAADFPPAGPHLSRSRRPLTEHETPTQSAPPGPQQGERGSCSNIRQDDVNQHTNLMRTFSGYSGVQLAG